MPDINSPQLFLHQSGTIRNRALLSKSLKLDDLDSCDVKDSFVVAPHKSSPSFIPKSKLKCDNSDATLYKSSFQDDAVVSDCNKRHETNNRNEENEKIAAKVSVLQQNQIQIADNNSSLPTYSKGLSMQDHGDDDGFHGIDVTVGSVKSKRLDSAGKIGRKSKRRQLQDSPTENPRKRKQARIKPVDDEKKSKTDPPNDIVSNGGGWLMV